MKWLSRQIVWTRKLLVAAVFLGLIGRLLCLCLVDYDFSTGDAPTYNAGARSLLEHGVFADDLTTPLSPSFYRPPLYSAFLAGVYALFGYHTLPVQLAQIAISLVTAVLVGHILLRVAPAAAPYGLILMMISPFEAVYSGALLSENLCALLGCGVAYCLTLPHSRGKWLVAGLVSGLTVLCRDIYLPALLLIPPVFLFLKSKSQQKKWIYSGIFYLAVGSVVLPWTCRNFFATGQLVIVSQGRLGGSLWAGSWAWDAAHFGAGMNGLTDDPYLNQDEKNRIQSARASRDIKLLDLTYKQAFIARLKQEPGLVLLRWIRHTPLLWLGTRFDIFRMNAQVFPPQSPVWYLVKSCLYLVNFTFVTFGLAGALVSARDRSDAAYLALPLLYTAAILFPLNDWENRYSQPVYPFVLALAGYALCRLSARPQPQGRPCSEVGYSPAGLASQCSRQA